LIPLTLLKNAAAGSPPHPGMPDSSTLKQNVGSGSLRWPVGVPPPEDGGAGGPIEIEILAIVVAPTS
jgi:hypothetical protein